MDKSRENMPTLVCLVKLLALFAGWATGERLTAQAKVFMSSGLRWCPDHRLQPEHSISTVQCVEFLDELRVV